MKTNSPANSLLVNQTSTVELITPQKAHEYLKFNPAIGMNAGGLDRQHACREGQS